jgi:2-dehydro-3-deoxyphosphogluconate aldolase/(4S)-4-hydroxy-2-oxoglutarate aldolase
VSEKQLIIDSIVECGVVAVVRGESEEQILNAISAALDGGINVIEITFTVPNPLKLISTLRNKVSDDVVLGAGTVINPEMALDAIQAGAQFIVAPSTNINTIEVTKSKGIPVFPGALTPTEVLTAWQAGADMIKIFPANIMGPGYIKDLHGPFPEIPLMPTGDVDLTTCYSWLEAGAACLGVGSALIDKKLMAAGDYAEITRRAREFRRIIQEFRNSHHK